MDGLGSSQERELWRMNRVLSSEHPQRTLLSRALPFPDVNAGVDICQVLLLNRPGQLVRLLPWLAGT